MKPKLFLLLIIPLAVILALVAGCQANKQNDLQRPAENNAENSNQTADRPIDDGEVAGQQAPLPTKMIKINNLELNTEVADTDVAREQGLSGREKLEDNTGMLFDFTTTSQKQPGFWMKDMLINIDIIWINNGKIIGIEANAPLPPEDADLSVYYPPAAITHVLEVPAGWATRNNIKVGDAVTL